MDDLQEGLQSGGTDCLLGLYGLKGKGWYQAGRGNEGGNLMELKANSGLLFRCEKKSKDSQPDYTGECLVGGKHWRMSAWIKISKKKGNTFMSFSFQEPYKGKETKPEVKSD